MNTSKERILALDLIRGYFLIAIIADHVSWNPNLFYIFSGGGRLFASPAEGFFIISGVLVGYLYTHKILNSTKLVVSKLWKRGFKFYLISALLTFIFHFASLALPEYRRIPLGMWEGSLPAMILNTMTLLFSYGWADFLPRYSMFMFFAPAALWLVAKSKWYLLFIASISLWTIARNNMNVSEFTAWQILFLEASYWEAT